MYMKNPNTLKKMSVIRHVFLLKHNKKNRYRKKTKTDRPHHPIISLCKNFCIIKLYYVENYVRSHDWLTANIQL